MRTEGAKRRAFGKLKKEEINVVWHWLDLDMILERERLTENRGKINPKRKGKTKFKFALELTLTIWTLANKDKKQSLLQ